ncbi:MULTISPECIES: LysR family transcriptional regulator [unclassified Rhizobium]|uniref:LysR family transcriptional regulator n=1 Tax=unclassified Rhizobium TaxID=2613769 RepID=UPI001618329F|nr:MULTISPECIES: LysR family transcriptional regulator [unclassified Rhizobium]MBB3289028.1 DNA-binding transcriptional LysR family regulator [Rhizobium sp. BK252]MBB3403770.1 DNA-binding transcriptional LysR family regulator [Rhizobium sp. BK289]MBB3416561.1 DNA-binding transcriptional LysR family regulator [Rhizobium sp. BK284]MBB3484233.1 DNA-binding transcriptional LysR family regulator [Rhizobium sp. BK347]
MKSSTPQIQIADLQSIRIFKAIADSGGLSAAQTKLGMSLSHISSTLTSFEERFGVKLCNRGRSGFSLTDAGKRIYASAAAVLDSLASFEEELAGVKGVIAGNLCLACHGGDYTHPSYILPEAISRFLARPNNHGTIQLEIGSQEFIAEGLVNGMIDIGIGHFPSAGSGLIKHKIYRETASLYCGLGHPLFTAEKAEWQPDDVVGFDFALRSAHVIPVSSLSNVSVRAIAPTQEARALLVLSGKFLAFLPDHVAERWVSSGEMRRLVGDSLSYSTEMEIVSRDTKHHAPLVAAFMEDYALVSVERTLPVPTLGL